MTSYFSRLDVDTTYLKLAQETLDEEGLVKAKVEVEPSQSIELDEQFIMQRFERMNEIKYDTELEKDYLVRFGGLDQKFIDFIYSTNYPTIQFEDGNFTLFGTRASIYLSFCALRNLINEHLNDQFMDRELLMKDSVFAEGIRKLILKLDMVRGSDFKFVESGTAIRYSYEWQVLVFNTLVADLKQNLVGTTNPVLGLLYGVPLYIPKTEPVRPVIDALKDGQEVEGNIYEMMHCYIHRGDRNTYLWSELSSDVVNLEHKIKLIV